MNLHNDTLIKKWEELRLEAYLPTPNDVWTIGWGHTKTAKRGMKITRQEAQRLFDSDVQWAEDAVNNLVKVPLTQNQFDALVSFVFNIGETKFRKSTMLRKLNAGDYEGAAAEFPRWNKQKGEVLRGLVRRRAEEMEYFLSPSDSKPSSKFLTEIPTNDIMKPLTKSKEAVGGAVAALTGGLAILIGDTSLEAQWLSEALPAALAGMGLFFLGNRLWARFRAKR